MPRLLLTIMLAMLLSANAWSQSAEPGAESETDPGAEATAEGLAAEEQAAEDEAEIDDDDVDAGSYADAEEEDFVPSEDIPTDQSIPFPTDI